MHTISTTAKNSRAHMQVRDYIKSLQTNNLISVQLLIYPLIGFMLTSNPSRVYVVEQLANEQPFTRGIRSTSLKEGGRLIKNHCQKIRPYRIDIHFCEGRLEVYVSQLLTDNGSAYLDDQDRNASDAPIVEDMMTAKMIRTHTRLRQR